MIEFMPRLNAFFSVLYHVYGRGPRLGNVGTSGNVGISGRWPLHTYMYRNLTVSGH